jgi:hypothetical protein
LGTNKGGPEKECERDWSVNGRETQRESESFMRKQKRWKFLGKFQRQKGKESVSNKNAFARKGKRINVDRITHLKMGHLR